VKASNTSEQQPVAFNLKSNTSYIVARWLDGSWTYLLLTVGAIITIIPFLWMFFTSFKPESEAFIFPPRLFPIAPTLEAYRTLFERVNFGQTFTNSIIITVSLTVLNMFICSLAGYAFAKMKFRGREKIFYIFLATMMIPGQVTIIPSFMVLKNLGLLNNYLGLIIPGSASVFGIFLVKQFMQGVPDDLIDAARIDGCTEFRVYCHIVIPLLKPVLATIAIFTFMGAWNDFLWPLIVMTSEKMYTLPVALSMLNGEHNTEWALLMAGAVIVTAPVLVIFFALQKYFIQGIAHTGLKG
jgi:multiple sugar transport system permease protein